MISAIIPSKNSDETLDACLQSVANSLLALASDYSINLHIMPPLSPLPNADCEMLCPSFHA